MGLMMPHWGVKIIIQPDLAHLRLTPLELKILNTKSPVTLVSYVEGIRQYLPGGGVLADLDEGCQAPCTRHFSWNKRDIP